MENQTNNTWDRGCIESNEKHMGSGLHRGSTLHGSSFHSLSGPPPEEYCQYSTIVKVRQYSYWGAVSSCIVSGNSGPGLQLFALVTQRNTQHTPEGCDEVIAQIFKMRMGVNPVTYFKRSPDLPVLTGREEASLLRVILAAAYKMVLAMLQLRTLNVKPQTLNLT